MVQRQAFGVILKRLYWLAPGLRTARGSRFRRKPRLLLVFLLHSVNLGDLCTDDVEHARVTVRLGEHDTTIISANVRPQKFEIRMLYDKYDNVVRKG